MRAETRKAVDEWQAEIERLRSSQPIDPSAKTVRELQTELGWSETAVRKYLASETAAGRVEAACKLVGQSNGVLRRVPAWKRVKSKRN